MTERYTRTGVPLSTWQSMAKIDLDKLQAMQEDNPRRTLQSLANEFDCSRERIRQVLISHGSRWTQRIRYRRPQYGCTLCGEPVTGPDRTCRVCYLQSPRAAERLQLSCDYCGGSFSLRVAEVKHRLRLADKVHPNKSKKWYCSRGCLYASRRKEN